MPYVDQIGPAVEPLPITLVLVSLAAGVAMLLIFRAVSRPDAIRAAKRRMQARLLELRLFGDEPALVWRAQTGLLAANMRYLRAMLIPILAVAIPFVLLFPHLDAIYGRAPLPPGAATVLTLRMHDPFGASLPDPRIELPPGLKAETAAVRVPAAHEISWELRAEGAVSQPVRIHLGSAAVEKMVRSGSRGLYLADAAEASPLAWVWDPGEPLIGAPGVDSVRIEYRAARFSWWGLELPWEAWFVIFSMVSALAAKSYWKVVF
jgi:hypothetical protein